MTSSGIPYPEKPAPPLIVDSGDGRAHRRGGSRVLSLPAYDVRVRRELAQRRLLISMTRHVLRVATLHLLDAIAIAAAAWIATAVIPGAENGAQYIPVLIAVMLVGLNANGAYRPGAARRAPRRLVLGTVVGVVILGVVTAFPPRLELGADVVVAFGLFAFVCIFVERRIVDVLIREAYAHGIGLRKAIVVGRTGDSDEVMRWLDGERDLDQRIAGYVTASRVHDSGALGTVDDIEAILDREDPSELIISSSLPSESLRRTADAAFKRGVRVIVIPWSASAIRGWSEPIHVGRIPAFHVHPTRLAMPAMLFKRATDVALASVALVVAAPAMLLIACIIKLDSRGPVFFRQRRVGLGGREFMMWKFRSMLHEAERRQCEIAHMNPYADGRLFKLRDDPRVTRVGRLLRRFSLDELPQLFNIIAGDMSLVGPRPPLPAEVGRYEPRHFVRLSVVPGLTGPWQVNGRNLITDFEEVVRLERSYVESWSFAVDLRIMAKTVSVVLSGKGAY